MKINYRKLFLIVKSEGKEFSIGLAIILAFFFIWLFFVNIFNL